MRKPISERAEYARKNGFGGIRLFGDWYLCRWKSKDYKRFSLGKYIWVVCNLKDKPQTIDTISIKADVKEW